MGERRKRKDRRRADQVESRMVNGKYKVKERERRRDRLKEKLKGDQANYSPTVLSWLSQELNKPSTSITPDDVKKWLATV